MNNYKQSNFIRYKIFLRDILNDYDIKYTEINQLLDEITIRYQEKVRVISTITPKTNQKIKNNINKYLPHSTNNNSNLYLENNRYERIIKLLVKALKCLKSCNDILNKFKEIKQNLDEYTNIVRLSNDNFNNIKKNKINIENLYANFIQKKDKFDIQLKKLS
jgi:hypothetical protein